MNKKVRKVMVDMSATFLHHGHIRLLKKASKYGRVIVALTKDKEINKFKGYFPEINYLQRKEILESICYVYKVVPSNFIINYEFLKEHKADLLIHGNDNKNKLNKKKILIFKRTSGISSSLLRKKILKIIKNVKKK